MMDYRTEIVLDAQDLAVGESSAYQTCPSCKSVQRSFGITRQEHGLLYNCFRASCGFRGFLPTSGALYQVKQREFERKPNPFDGEVESVDSQDLDYFQQRFELALGPRDVVVAKREQDAYGIYAMPMFAANGREDGLVLRRGGWGGMPPMPEHRAAYCDGPKTVLYRDTLRCATSWYYPRHDGLARFSPGVIVLVEDCVSAMKVAQAGVTAVSLLGSSMNDEVVREIAQEHPREVVLALDADATSNAFKLARKYGLAFHKMRVAPLTFDLKDESKYNVLAVLGL